VDKPEIIVKIDKLYKEAKEYRKQFESKWKEEQRFYMGKQWKFADKRPVKNWCFTIVEGELPILTDSRPASDVVPYQAEEMEDAKVLSSGMHYIYDEQNLMLKVSEVMRNALKAGPCGYHYVGHDPCGEKGEGKITIKTMPWDQVYLDPSANLIEDVAYAILEIPTKKEDAIRLWPKKKKKIEELSTSNNNAIGDTQDEYIDPTRWDGIGGITDDTFEKSRYQSEDTLTLRESWIKDYSMEKIPPEITEEEIVKESQEIMQGINPDIGLYENHEEHMRGHEEHKVAIAASALGVPEELITDEMIEQVKASDPNIALMLTLLDDHIDEHVIHNEDNPKAERPKYVNNLRLVISIDHLVLFDGTPDVEDGMIPLVAYYCYKTGDSIYGFSEIRNIISSQKSYNEMDYSEYKGLKLNTNSGFVKDENSGVDSDTLTNVEGLVITKVQGTEVRRLDPGTVSPQLGMRKQNDQIAMEQISGVNEATQGRRPVGVTAAQAIRYLQEQSVGRIRLKTRMLEEYSLLRLGKLITARIVNYWNTERMLRIYDQNGKIQYVKYDPDRIQQMRYEVKVVPGSTAGLDKESIFTVMSNLADKGMIPPKTFIESVDIPYKNKILEDIEANDQLRMQAEALAAENEELKGMLQEADKVLGAEENNIDNAPTEAI